MGCATIFSDNVFFCFCFFTLEELTGISGTQICSHATPLTMKPLCCGVTSWIKANVFFQSVFCKTSWQSLEVVAALLDYFCCETTAKGGIPPPLIPFSLYPVIWSAISIFVANLCVPKHNLRDLSRAGCAPQAIEFAGSDCYCGSLGAAYNQTKQYKK